jgi:hypothetical protein
LGIELRCVTMLRTIAILLAVLELGVTSLPTSTPQPENAGKLANRQFLLKTSLGQGYARYLAPVRSTVTGMPPEP